MSDSAAVRTAEAGAGRDASLANATLRLRRLPDGDFRNGIALEWKGRLLEIDAPGEGFSVGMPIEVECGPMVYLGELLSQEDPRRVVLVEHSVNRDDLQFDQDI